MVSTTLVFALVASSILSLAAADSSAPSSTVVSIATPTATYSPNSMTDIGCFDTGVPLEDHGEYLFQSQGNCQGICILLKKPVLGLVDGTNCWCGDLLPQKSAQTDNSSCNTPCSGIDTLNCGGNQKWWISLTGITKNEIANYDPSSASSTKAAATSTPVVTQAPSTVVVVSSESAAAVKKESGPNKAGIAAGVVVGVVALAGIIGGVFFYLKQKKRRELEEEHQRQANLNQFMAGGKSHTSNSSVNDSRLDPEMMRRQSSGSIADNEDYSRRILKVTNF